MESAREKTPILRGAGMLIIPPMYTVGVKILGFGTAKLYIIIYIQHNTC